MFITYKNVQNFVENSSAGEVVGKCGSAFHCLIAEAVMEKYPKLTTVSVGLNHDAALIDVRGTNGILRSEEITTGDDSYKLFCLADRFDKLGGLLHEVTREEALELFK